MALCKEAVAGFIVQNNTNALVGADSVPVISNLVPEVEIRDLYEALV